MGNFTSVEFTWWRSLVDADGAARWWPEVVEAGQLRIARRWAKMVESAWKP